MADDALIELSSVLEIVKSNETERVYLMKIKAATNDSSATSDDDTVTTAFTTEDYLMTTVLNGSETYIRYNKGEISVFGDSDVSMGSFLQPVTYKYGTPKNLIEEVRKFLLAQSKPL